MLNWRLEVDSLAPFENVTAGSLNKPIVIIIFYMYLPQISVNFLKNSSTLDNVRIDSGMLLGMIIQA